MYPFKVKVINICTGGVKTSLAANSIATYDLHLPPTSLYLPIEEFFKKRQGYSNVNAIPAEKYARQVVSAVGRARASGWIWRGYFAFGAWFLSTFLWREVFDIFMLNAFGLKKFRKMLTLKKE